MALFLIIYFVFYGALHAYAFFKAKAAFGFGPVTGAVIVLFMLLMILAPIITRALESRGHETSAMITAHTGYIWMGTLSLFAVTAIIVGVYRLIMFALGNFLRLDLSAIIPSPFSAFMISLIFGIVLAIYGVFEASDIRTEHLTISTDKIAPSAARIRIVQISDVHLGLMVGKHRLKKIIDTVNVTDPDILVSTGDLVDGQLDNIMGCMKSLDRVKPRLGKFAVIGNHELYAGLDRSVELTEAAGFRLLRDEAASAGDSVVVAGFDDSGNSRQKACEVRTEIETLSGLPRSKFILVLKHKPEVPKDIYGLFDLQLSGHLHGGQIFAFIPLLKIAYPHHLSGLYELPENGRLYISRGTGLWGPPMRILAPPEITVIDIIPAG